MATRKAWDDHSERWKRQASREGLDPHRWNAWRKLSPKSRAKTDPRRYAAGESVQKQNLDKLQRAAVSAIMAAKGGDAREFTVRRGVQKMSSRELNKIGQLAPGPLGDYITRKARQPMPPGVRNPYWYR
jgi:hypothetical protein